MNQPNIVVMGGGTGTISLLRGLKDRVNLTVITNMADDGGSTGIIRDELGVRPGGDTWKCIAALSDDEPLRDLLGYRFTDGVLKGHSLGNIFMAAGEKMTDHFDEAVTMLSSILKIRGQVIPVTLDNVRLAMTWPHTGEVLHGEHRIDDGHFPGDPRKATLTLVPEAEPNQAAIAAIEVADIIVLAPGDLYTSLGPELAVKGIGSALQQTKAVKVYVSNLVTKPGHTDGFTVADHADEIERLAGGAFLDYVLYNQQLPNRQLLARYEKEGAHIVEINPPQLEMKQYQTIAGDFLGAVVEADTSESLGVTTRSFVRHDPAVIADAIMTLYDTRNR